MLYDEGALNIWPTEILDILALYFFILKIITPTVIIIIAISSFDDFLIDSVYLTRRIIRYFRIYRRTEKWDISRIRPIQQQPLALLIPAWDEGGVITEMLRYLVQSYDYQNYQIYVGIYPNDPKTWAAVETLRRENTRYADKITVVINSKDGPTSKADCLNTLFTHIEQNPIKPNIYVIHDAEDVVDSKEAWVFNHLIPRKAMVQLPVQPLVRHGLDLIGGHYADEFSEAHRKDLIAREAMTGGVPSAGVGCAYSRHALHHIAKERGGVPFNVNSLTEDYDLALAIRRAGMKSVFVRAEHPQKPNCTHKHLATRAYFPNTVRAAIRQKSRWLIGITLQSWASFGWQGAFFQRYMLWRDRKTLVTSTFNVLALFLTLNMGLLVGLPYVFPSFPRFPSLINFEGLSAYLILLNGFFLCNRLAHRLWHVWALYGVKQAVISLLRIPLSIIINFAATFRAFKIYYQSSGSGQAPKWDKTHHSFPSTLSAPTQPRP